MVEIVNINIDVISVVLVAITAVRAVMVMIVIIMVMVVVIPVDVTEQCIRRRNAQAIAETFDEAIGKLLARRGRQIDRGVGGIRPTAVNNGWIVVRHIYHLWIGRLNFDNRRGGRAAGHFRR